MTNFLKTWFLLFEMKNIAKVNRTYYFFQNLLPILKDVLPSSFYKKEKVKKILIFLVVLFGFLFKLLKLFLLLSIFALFSSVVYPNISYSSPLKPIVTMNLWFIFIILIFNFISNYYANIFDQDELDLIKHFKFNVKLFYYIKFLNKVCYSQLVYMILFAFKLQDGSAYYLISMFFLYAISHIVYRRMHQIHLLKEVLKKAKIQTNIQLVGTFAIITAFLGYLAFNNLLLFLNTPLASVLLLFVYISAVYLDSKYISTSDVYIILHNAEEKIKDYQEIKTADMVQGVALEKELVAPTQSEVALIKDKKSLNVLLFKRYNSLIWKNLKKMMLLQSAFVIFVIAAYVYKLFTPKFNDFISILETVSIVLYLSAQTRKIVEMCFINCDIAMLFYPFYRTREIILDGFYYRFKKILFYNTIGYASLILGYYIMILLAPIGHKLMLFVISTGYFILYTIFFSFHELFLYYIIQPYTTEKKINSIWYKIIMGVTFFILYNGRTLSMRFENNYLLILSFFVLIYCVIGSFIVYKKAPKTFRIKS